MILRQQRGVTKTYAGGDERLPGIKHRDSTGDAVRLKLPGSAKLTAGLHSTCFGGTTSAPSVCLSNEKVESPK
jgi:hypothetical protein